MKGLILGTVREALIIAAAIECKSSILIERTKHHWVNRLATNDFEGMLLAYKHWLKSKRTEGYTEDWPDQFGLDLINLNRLRAKYKGIRAKFHHSGLQSALTKIQWNIFEKNAMLEFMLSWSKLEFK